MKESRISERVVSAAAAEHYTWGDRCDGWYLVRTPELHVIEERMPSGTSEQAHHHLRARQFFYVLEGELTMALGESEVVVRGGEGLEIAPGEVHQAVNRGAGAVQFLVASQPPSHGDRVDA
ncbi:MAG TPA: cupin domain-containing protein [Acidobacteriaceae bacterium]|nr:cupin domain-containing protein [Acidobacteriaceae bacterium]